jgi:hypothetical protein
MSENLLVSVDSQNTARLYACDHELPSTVRALQVPSDARATAVFHTELSPPEQPGEEGPEREREEEGPEIMLYLGHENGDVTTWRSTLLGPIQACPSLPLFSDRVTRVQACGPQILAASQTGEIALCSLQGSPGRVALIGHEALFGEGKPVHLLEWRPSFSLVCAASAGGDVCVWDCRNLTSPSLEPKWFGILWK